MTYYTNLFTDVLADTLHKLVKNIEKNNTKINITNKWVLGCEINKSSYASCTNSNDFVAKLQFRISGLRDEFKQNLENDKIFTLLNEIFDILAYSYSQFPKIETDIEDLIKNLCEKLYEYFEENEVENLIKRFDPILNKIEQKTISTDKPKYIIEKEAYETVKNYIETMKKKNNNFTITEKNLNNYITLCQKNGINIDLTDEQNQAILKAKSKYIQHRKMEKSSKITDKVIVKAKKTYKNFNIKNKKTLLITITTILLLMILIVFITNLNKTDSNLNQIKKVNKTFYKIEYEQFNFKISNDQTRPIKYIGVFNHIINISEDGVGYHKYELHDDFGKKIALYDKKGNINKLENGTIIQVFGNIMSLIPYKLNVKEYSNKTRRFRNISYIDEIEINISENNN
jgi:hypothetical protein